MSEGRTSAKQKPFYHGILPPLLPPGQMPSCYVYCRCAPVIGERVMLLLDAHRRTWQGVCGHCGREHWAQNAGWG